MFGIIDFYPKTDLTRSRVWELGEGDLGGLALINWDHKEILNPGREPSAGGRGCLLLAFGGPRLKTFWVDAWAVGGLGGLWEVGLGVGVVAGLAGV